MLAPTAHRITVEEFDRLDLPEDRDLELQDGEVVEATFPELMHRRLQSRLSKLLEQLSPFAEVLTEYPFQIGDRDKRSADVGIVAQDRAQASGRKILLGAPDIVIEVFSPSNSWPKM